MNIKELTVDECAQELARRDVGRLACVRDGQPYIVPINYSLDGGYLYGVTSLGQKIEWMRANPRVCVEIDERENDYRWMSVVVFGRYEELPDTAEGAELRAHALELAQRRPLWWQPAALAADRSMHRPPVFYRIRIESMTGRRASPDALESAAAL